MAKLSYYKLNTENKMNRQRADERYASIKYTSKMTRLYLKYIEAKDRFDRAELYLTRYKRRHGSAKGFPYWKAYNADKKRKDDVWEAYTKASGLSSVMQKVPEK